MPICAHPAEELGFYSPAFIIKPWNPNIPTFAGQLFCVTRNQQRHLKVDTSVSAVSTL